MLGNLRNRRGNEKNGLMMTENRKRLVMERKVLETMERDFKEGLSPERNLMMHSHNSSGKYEQTAALARFIGFFSALDLDDDDAATIVTK